MTITIDFAAIRARHPLAEYCRQRGIELHKNGTSGELKGLCPLHKEKSPSFHVYPDNHYCCYGCGAHGDVTNLEQALGSGTRAEAAERLGAERGLPFNSRHHSQHARGKAGDLSLWLVENRARVAAYRQTPCRSSAGLCWSERVREIALTKPYNYPNRRRKKRKTTSLHERRLAL